MIIPLEKTGLMIGAFIVVCSMLLQFRKDIEPYLPEQIQREKNFVYPETIPILFFMVGVSIIFITTNFSVVNLIESDEFALLGQIVILAAGIVAMHYFWFIYPSNHPLFEIFKE